MRAVVIALLVIALLGALGVIGSGFFRVSPNLDAEHPSLAVTSRPTVLPTDVPRSTIFTAPPIEYADAPGQLAYTGAGGSFLANADGSSPRRIAGGLGYGVEWARDGRHLLYQGPGASRDGMFHVSDATGNLIFSREGCCATWSPDGTRVAALLFDWNWGGVRDREPGDAFLIVLDLNGAVTTQIRLPKARAGNLVQVFWFPDGRSLIVDDLYHGEGGNLVDTWAISLDTGEARPYPIKPVYGARSFFSPDGSRVVGYATELLVVAAADGTLARRLADGTGWYASAWSPDSRSIAMLLGRGEELPELHVVDAATGEILIRFRADEAGSELRIGYVMDWSPNDGRILFSAAAGLWAAHPDASDFRLLVPGIDEGGWQPVLAPGQ